MHAGEIATMDDWETHLSTVFPDVRLKKFLEMRGADGGPWSMICALPALWVGLIYDDQAQKECLEMISDWSIDEMTALREEVQPPSFRPAATLLNRCLFLPTPPIKLPLACLHVSLRYRGFVP